MEEVAQALKDRLHVIVDITKLRSVDNDGLRTFIKIQKMCDDHDVLLKIVARHKMENHMKELMPDGHFAFYRDKDDATDSFHG